MVASKRTYTALALLMAVALVMWVWFGLDRTIQMDDGISILAAQGIVEHGLQRMPSGYLYHRGYVPHYLLAGSIRLFGLNDVAIMLPSLLMALGSLWFVFLLARDVIGRPWAGVITAALLLTIQSQTLYAVSPRFYMPLQFFTLLATYSAWRGYIQGHTVFRILAFAAIVAAVLSHREGVALAVTLPVSVTVVVLVVDRRFPSGIVSAWTVAGATIVTVAAVFMLAYSPPGTMPTVIAYVEQAPGLASAVTSSSDFVEWAKGLLQPKRALLYVLSLMPAALFVAISGGRGRYRETPPGLIYVLCVSTLTVLMLIIGTGRVDGRLWLFVVPLYGLFLVTGASLMFEKFGSNRARLLGQRLLGQTPAYGLVMLLVVAGVTIATLSVGLLNVAPQYVNLAMRAFGPRCIHLDCERSIKAHYAKVKRDLKPGDFIVSGDPWVTSYYMGSVDGILREKVIYEPDKSIWFQDLIKTDKVTRFESLNDEYFGIPLVDLRDLPALLQADRRVVIITDWSILQSTSIATRDFLEDRFIRLHSDPLSTTYVNCARQPC